MVAILGGDVRYSCLAMIAFRYGRFSEKNFTGVAAADPAGVPPGLASCATVISSVCPSGSSPRSRFSQEMASRRAAPMNKLAVGDAGPVTQVHALTWNPDVAQ